MKDNIKPEHYRKGEIDLFESWYRTRPFNEFRAIMESVAERYMKRDKEDRVLDIGKAIYTLERLKEKEIEYRDGQVKSKDEVIDDAIEFRRNYENQERVVTSENIHKPNNQEYASTLMNLLYRGFEYVARDSDGELAVYDVKPVKFDTQWSDDLGDWIEPLDNDYFPEVKWSDEEPTKIADLWEIYENGGENGE